MTKNKSQFRCDVQNDDTKSYSYKNGIPLQKKKIMY